MFNRPVLLYYITDRKQFPGNDDQQRRRLLGKIAEAARAGVDYIQLREKDLSARELEVLSCQAVRCVRESRQGTSKTRLLINSRTDIALASSADGVHLTSNDVSAAEIRALVAKTVLVDSGERFTVGVSCHSVDEVLMAESQGADFAVLAPVFGKIAIGAPGIGLSAFRELAKPAQGAPGIEAGETRGRMPVLALGGVAVENADRCRTAGAAGVAGIRMFQEGDVAEVVKRLAGISRSLVPE